MPSNLPSSFASAAAGQNRDGRSGARNDMTRGSGSGEWLRRDGRSLNGTLTFRRSSNAPASQSTPPIPADAHQTLSSDATSISANHQPAAFDSASTYRYSRDDLLEVYKAAPDSAFDVASLLEATWNPGQVNGSSPRPWGKPESSHVPQDPSVCWDTSGGTRPIALQEMSGEEKELFASDVNSPLKIPQQNKDGGHATPGIQNGRKASVSHGGGGNFATSSPSTASRPGTRRRETTDTNPFPAGNLTSPTNPGRFARDDSSWFARKNADAKETSLEDPADESTRDQPSRPQQVGTLNRNNTTGGSGFSASSIWGSTAASPAIGSFGNFSLGAQSSGDKRFGAGGGSRLAHLIPKDNADGSPATKPGEGAVTGAGAGAGANPDMSRSWRARPRTDTDPFGSDDCLSGSAVLGGAQESSPPPMTAQLHRVGPFDTPVKGSAGDFGMAGLNLGGHSEGIDAASPETNPFQSPPADRGDDGHDPAGLDRAHVSNVGTEQPSSFGTLPRGFGTNTFDGSDRSQTSSVGAKSHPALSVLASGGWPAGPSTGTPDRERPAFTSAFGSSIFSPVGDLQSPGLGGLGGIFGAPSASSVTGTGSLRGSKLGSLFPPAMQAQMQGQDQDSLSDSLPDLRQSNPLGAIGRAPIGSQARETESPMRTGRGVFDDLFQPPESARLPYTTSEQGQPGLTTTTQGQSSFTPTGTATTTPFSANQSSADPPAAQARTMVMPDRMRWVYLDPQGQIQGPFTGLEMNDWYKAQFFSADLRVRKLEDPEFEPLGQLIRRIGNSREPFLVPQIGIPHGPPSQGGPFPPGDSRGVVPPLMGAFPSFGRTLTAEEQNNLERRKQEEQFMMARQREFFVQQQAFTKLQMQTPGAPGALHHHSSAHSLQSQPSFGSITSPIGMPPQAALGALGPNPGFFESPGTNLGQSSTQPAIGSASDIFTPDLNIPERQMLAGLQGGVGPTGGFPTQPIGTQPADASLRSQLPSADQLQKDDQEFSARFKEFHEIRAQRDAEDVQETVQQKVTAATVAHGDGDVAEMIKEATKSSETSKAKQAAAQSPPQQHQQPLSLTQQVQKAQAAAQAAAAAASKHPEDMGLPMRFPPPSTTPLPAPMAQRGHSTLPTQFNAPSPSETPDTTAEPPPLAPWAPQPGSGTQKGPSLKEIQEMEAKKAAKAEEAAATARRALLEQEAAALRERERANASVTSGLPLTSTWGTGSPVNAPSSSSPWAKPPAAGKVGGPGAVVGAAAMASAQKKTLADIQREEEVRKLKAARESAVHTSPAPAASGSGKRYADLASKASAPPGLISHSPVPAATQPSGSGVPLGTGGGWATVGAGGKVKIPTGPASQARTASSSIVKPTTPATLIAKPAAVAKPAPSPAKENGNAAVEEFHKWLHRELSRGLDGIKDIDAFASNLLGFPLDTSILADAVYANSSTMDGRHFAEEFVRRKRLADKGIVEKQPVKAGPAGSSKNDSEGWSEVAKKGGSGSSSSQREDASLPGGQFKVVPSRRKGKK